MATIDESIARDVARYLEMARESGRPPFEDMSVADARAAYRAGKALVNLPSIEIGEVVSDYLGGRGGPVGIRRYLPKAPLSAPAPTILFLHGGGWVVGDLDTHDSICRHLVRATGLQVVAVDYRLAPEHRFPAAIDDATDAYALLIAQSEAWNIDPDGIILMGDSAGGALALVTAMHARDMCRPLPRAMALFYPVTDLRGETDSYRHVRDVPMTGRTMRWFRSQFLRDEKDALDWRASPLLARDYVCLPPTFLSVCGLDPLHDEGMQLAARLEDAGIPLTLRHLPGHIHGYLTIGRMVAEAEETIAAVARFLDPIIGR